MTSYVQGATCTERGGLALAFTVKNEWELLKYLIPFYLASGVDLIYLFFDGTTDAALDEAKEFPRVKTFQSIAVEELSVKRDWLLELDPRIMDHRKRINTMYAVDDALLHGLEWFGCIDADEIIYVDRLDLASFLKSVDGAVDQLLLRNLELLPSFDSNKLNPFVSQKYFLERPERLFRIWRFFNYAFRKLELAPPVVARFENAWFRGLSRGSFPEPMVSPLSSRKVFRGFFLGYTNHKAIIRTRVARKSMFNVHQWEEVECSIKSQKKGEILHYDLPSTDYFLKKFRQRESNMQREVFHTRFQLGKIARECDDDTVRQFFENQICVANEEELNEMKARGLVREIHDIADFFVRAKLH